MAVKLLSLVLGTLLLSGMGFAQKGKKGAREDRIECGSYTRDIDGAMYAYYREGDEIYVEAAPEFWTNVTAYWESKNDFDSQCTKDIFHKMGFLAFNPQGHPGVDFQGGGYGVPHWDMHFFRPTVADTEAGGEFDVSSCEVTGPVPVLCDLNSEDPRNVKFNTLPPEEEITGFVNDELWGGHAVIGHGLHLLDARSFLPGGPSHITLNNNGITSPVDRPPFAVCLDQLTGDKGCRLGAWDGLDPVLITYNGQVIAQEPMFTNTIVTNLASQITESSELVVRAQKSFPAAQKYKYNTKYATDVYVQASNGEDGKIVRIGIVVDKINARRGKGKKGGLTSAFSVTGNWTKLSVSGGAAMLIVGTALAILFVKRRSNTKTIRAEDSDDLEYSEVTPLNNV